MCSSKFPELLWQRLSGDKRVFDISGDEEGVIVEGVTPNRAPAGEGLAAHHVRVQQLLHLLHRPLCAGQGAQPAARKRCEAELRRAGAPGIQGHHAAGAERELLWPGSATSIVILPTCCAGCSQVPGDFVLRFMTSHPKDASEKLFATMAECDKGGKASAPALPIGQQPGAQSHEPLL